MSKTRYHINPETGRPNLCSAQTPEGCKYAHNGVIPQHYENKVDARKAYEDSMSENMFTPKKKTSEKVLTSEEEHISSIQKRKSYQELWPKAEDDPNDPRNVKVPGLSISVAEYRSLSPMERTLARKNLREPWNETSHYETGTEEFLEEALHDGYFQRDVRNLAKTTKNPNSLRFAADMGDDAVLRAVANNENSPVEALVVAYLRSNNNTTKTILENHPNFKVGTRLGPDAEVFASDFMPYSPDTSDDNNKF